MTPDDDPVIEELREPRRKASAACGHDPAKLVEYYMRLQEQHRDRLLALAPARRPAAPPDRDAA